MEGSGLGEVLVLILTRPIVGEGGNRACGSAAPCRMPSPQCGGLPPRARAARPPPRRGRQGLRGAPGRDSPAPKDPAAALRLSSSMVMAARVTFVPLRPQSRSAARWHYVRPTIPTEARRVATLTRNTQPAPAARRPDLLLRACRCLERELEVAGEALTSAGSAVSATGSRI